MNCAYPFIPLMPSPKDSAALQNTNKPNRHNKFIFCNKNSKLYLIGIPPVELIALFSTMNLPSGPGKRIIFICPTPFLSIPGNSPSDLSQWLTENQICPDFSPYFQAGFISMLANNSIIRPFTHSPVQILCYFCLN